MRASGGHPRRAAEPEEHVMATAVRKRKIWAADYGLPLVVRLRPVLDLSEDQFFAFCQLNGDLRIERNAEGELLIMPPAGGDTSDRNSEINMQLRMWAKRDGSGVVFDSSGGFRLPNRAVRSPDASWMLRSRYEQIPAAERRVFVPACPDFVLELRSPSDRLQTLQAKMREYLANGARLGWLLDPESRRVYVYRPDRPVERLDDPATLVGDPVLVGFVLNLHEIW
jgi:Uma2 family endonuclease